MLGTKTTCLAPHWFGHRKWSNDQDLRPRVENHAISRANQLVAFVQLSRATIFWLKGLRITPRQRLRRRMTSEQFTRPEQPVGRPLSHQPNRPDRRTSPPRSRRA